MSLLSLIIPCHNEEQTIPFFLKEVDRVASSKKREGFELIIKDMAAVLWRGGLSGSYSNLPYTALQASPPFLLPLDTTINRLTLP